MEAKHITDIVFSHIYGKREEAFSAASKRVPEIKKKIFISDWEARKLYNKEKNEIAVSSNAILSPLSLDWLEYQNVSVVSRK